MPLRLLLLLVCALSVVMGCTTRSKLIKIDTRDNESEVFYFQNTSCWKRADYTAFFKTDNALQVKEIFNLKVAYERKMEKAKELSPKFQELEAVLFDFCYEYGEERISKEQYLEQRRIYDGIRQRILEPVVVTPPPPPPAESLPPSLSKTEPPAKQWEQLVQEKYGRFIDHSFSPGQIPNGYSCRSGSACVSGYCRPGPADIAPGFCIAISSSCGWPGDDGEPRRGGKRDLLGVTFECIPDSPRNDRWVRP